MSCTSEGVTSLKNLRLKQILSQEDNTPVNNDNDAEEKQNVIVDNFQTEFLQSNPQLKDRLCFLQPTNENGIKKFVCTYIQPTLLPYSEFFDLNSAAAFIARYVTYEPLSLDDSLGQVVVSPSQTLASAAGDCLDMSFLLASLLLGAGYNAFVVFGKTPKWICLKDQSHQQLILTQQGNDEVAICIKDECFTNKQSTSEDNATHCWVLVKAAGGKKDVEEDVFVEASTGVIYPVDKSPYSQVDSVCNDKNCLINVGESVETFDFDNTKQWVSVLPETYSLPTNSWTKAISLPKDKFLLRYPSNGKRVILLEKAKVELFGDNVDSEGCVKRITHYEDTARTVALESIEIFSPTHRTDDLTKRSRRPLDFHEYFSLQQEHFITERIEIAGKMSSLKFLPKSRIDGLIERVEHIEENGSSNIITEHFHNRSDNLVRREIHVSLLPHDTKPKESERFPSSGGGGGVRVILNVHEHFTESTDDSKSVACRSFLVNEGSVRELYHAEHEVLQTATEFSLKDVGKGDSHEKDLSQMMTASLSSVKKIQSETLTIRKSLFDHEMKIVESTESNE